MKYKCNNVHVKRNRLNGTVRIRLRA